MEGFFEIVGGAWAFLVIGGPIVLGLALIYAVVQSRKRRRTPR
jgi:hypothetical protein